MIEIREGGFYKTRDGRKAGPMCRFGVNDALVGVVDGDEHRRVFMIEGGVHDFGMTNLDLIAEWVEGPVRTVTRREVVEGVYSRIEVLKPESTREAQIRFATRIGSDKGGTVHIMTSTELKAAAAVLLELAGALE